MIDQKPIKQVAQEHYDVVIVGGGITGAIMARVLTESAWRDGKVISVLILEAGPPTPYSDPGYQAHMDTFYGDIHKFPNSPYPPSASAPNPGSPGEEEYYLQEGPLHFGSDNTRYLGGTTLHWMGISLRMMPADFTMCDTYGKGVNWPISYHDLRSDYEKAEWEIGVAGNVEDQKRIYGVSDDYFRRGYDFPMEGLPTSYLDSVFTEGIGKGYKHKLAGKSYPVELVPIPQARNAKPRSGIKDPRNYLAEGRATNKDESYQPTGAPDDPVTGKGQRCEGNASCIPICPARAKYTALKTLGEVRTLADNPNIRVDVVSRAVVSEVLTDDSDKVTQLVVKKYHDDRVAFADTVRVSGRFFVLAGSAIENAKILLISRTRKDKVVANHSDQIGRNLMDHPFVLTWGRNKEPVWPFRGPGVTSDLPMRDGAFRKKHAAFRTDISNWGWGLAANSPQSDLDDLLPKPGTKRKQYTKFKSLREDLGNALKSQIVMGYLFEQLPDPSNRVTLRENWVDDLGIPKPVLRYDIDDYSRAGVEAAVGLTKKVFGRMGATDLKAKFGIPLPYKDYEYAYIGAGHIMGTHRMGSSRDDSVVNSYQQSWDHKNLYITGCGSMPTAGTSNPTLTAAALSIRSGEHLYKKLRLRDR